MDVLDPPSQGQIELSKDLPTEISREDRRIVMSWLLTHLNENTRRSYARDIKNFYGCYPKTSLKEISHTHLIAWLEVSRKRGASRSSLQAKRATFSSLMKYLIRARIIDRNPLDPVAPIKVADTRSKRVLSEEDIWRLIGAAGSLRNQLLLEFIYFSGLRVSEVGQVCFSDFRLQSESNVALSVTGKGDKQRVVLLPRDLYDRILELRPDGGEAKVCVGGVARAKVFRSQKEPYDSLSPSAIHRIVKSAAFSAHLTEQTSTHWLRHCNATHSLQNGASLDIVKETLGHASLATTERYLHGVPRDSTGNHLMVQNRDEERGERELDIGSEQERE